MLVGAEWGDTAQLEDIGNLPRVVLRVEHEQRRPNEGKHVLYSDVEEEQRGEGVGQVRSTQVHIGN